MHQNEANSLGLATNDVAELEAGLKYAEVCDKQGEKQGLNFHYKQNSPKGLVPLAKGLIPFLT